MLYVFRSCREFVRTLPILQYSRTSPEDVDSEGEDHIADETRYLCMLVPMSGAHTHARRVSTVWDPLDRPVRLYADRMVQRNSKNKENICLRFLKKLKNLFRQL